MYHLDTDSVVINNGSFSWEGNDEAVTLKK